MNSYTASNQYIIIKKDEPRFNNGSEGNQNKTKNYAIARLEHVNDVEDIDCEPRLMEIVNSIGVTDRSYLSKIAVEQFQTDFLKNQEIKLYMDRQKKMQFNEKKKQMCVYDDFEDFVCPVTRSGPPPTNLVRLKRKKVLSPLPSTPIEGMQAYDSSSDEDL